MLGWDEENKLDDFIAKMEDEWIDVFTLPNFQWLTDKLKEVNDEVKRMKLYSPKNEISDRFEPR